MSSMIFYIGLPGPSGFPGSPGLPGVSGLPGLKGLYFYNESEPKQTILFLLYR